jgi:ABC-type bacteriocin/lantibiotic exporter with double-glycine peptidase domain
MYSNIDVRKDFFKKIEGMDYTSFHQKDKDYYSSMMITDLDNFYKDYYENLIYGIIRIVELSVFSIALCFVSWLMGIILISVSFVSLFVPRMVGKKLDEKKEKVSETNALYLHDLSQLLSGHDYYNSATEEKLESEHQRKSVLRENVLFNYNRYYSFVEIFGGLSLYIVNIVVFVSGIILVFFNELSLGGFVASMVFCDMFAVPFGDFIYIMIGIRSSKAYMNKFMSYLNNPSISSHTKIEFNKKIVFSNIIAHNGTFSLDPIDICFSAGKKYAIVGDNGSGKTTLLKLFLGFLKPDSGSIIIDGKSVTDFDASSFAAYIDQNVFLFDDTVENNISLFGSFDISNIQGMLAEIRLDVVLSKKVGEFGLNISGGERSKIALARAINQGKKCLLLDESLASVDDISKKEIQDFLFKNPCTVISVTHDISPEHLERFDYIIEIKNGIAEEFESWKYLSLPVMQRQQ